MGFGIVLKPFPENWIIPRCRNRSTIRYENEARTGRWIGTIGNGTIWKDAGS